MYFDILVIPEHHCLNDQVIEIEDYKVIQFNRQTTGNLRHGSGGIAIAMHNSLLDTHTIVATIKGSDGQLAIKLKHLKTDFTIGIMGLYLSPDSFHYGQDAEGYFNESSVLWDDLGDCDLLVGAGDVNARTKQLLDYIPDIDGDLIPERINPDKVKNPHGDAFLTFLKGNRAIILNGRITPQFNNFTFVTSRGCSVPDYIFSPVNHLHFCKEMKTLLITDLVNSSGLKPPQTIPDHSILQGTFITSLNQSSNNDQPFKSAPKSQQSQPSKRNLKKINTETFFMSEEVHQQVVST